MLHQFIYVSYQTITNADKSETKLKHHVSCSFDDESMVFTAKHLGDSVNDGAIKLFAEPIELVIPDDQEIRLTAGDEDSDVKLPFISALAVQQFRIWISGQVSVKDSITDEQIGAASVKLPDKQRAAFEMLPALFSGKQLRAAQLKVLRQAKLVD